MRFDLTDLRLFLNIHEAGTITAGARASHMTLASASERVLGMEAELGVPLLTRDRRGTRATAAGHALAHHARLVLGQIDRMHDALGDFSAGLRGHVRLMCNTSAASEHLPDIISGYLIDHSGLSVDLDERTSHEIADAVRNRQCDIGVMADSVARDGLTCFPFRTDPLVLVARRDHPVVQRSSCAFAEIVDLTFVGLSEGSALHDHLVQHARRLGRRLDYRARVRSLESICRMAGSGVGVGIVPRAAATRHARSAAIKTVALTDEWAQRSLLVCVRDPDALPEHVQHLLRHILAHA